MQTVVRLWKLAVAGMLLVTLVSATPAPVDARYGPPVSATVLFTVDNSADISDADPGDGRCEIPTDGGGSRGEPRTRTTVPKGGKDTQFQTIPTLYPPITPSAPDGSGLCTLRAAVEESNANPEVNHEVTLPSDLGVYRLTDGQLRVKGHLRVGRDFSEGSKRSAINAGHRSRIFLVESGAHLHADGLFLSQGKPAGSGGGGAIMILDEGFAQVKRSVIVNNRASFGGGVYVSDGGRLDSLYTSYESNTAQSGGGIFLLGLLEFEQSSVYNNTADSFGGGLFVNGHHGGHFWFRNSSILDNVAGKDGGGMYRVGPGFSELRFTTVVGNSARHGGGLFNVGHPIRIANSVVADNTGTTDPAASNASPDCAGGLDANGTNLIGIVSPTCWGYDASTDLIGSGINPLDPGLETVRISTDGNRWGDGGELAYRRPAASSPLLDVLPADRCSENRDMLGPNKRVRVPCDLGAIER